MHQFDVCRLRHGGALVVNCQSDLLDHLPTRLVVPLIPIEDAPTPAERLNPIFRIADCDFMLAPQYAASVETGDLAGADFSLASDYLRVTVAIDFLVGGY